jgi:hexosaminidase
MMVRSAVLLAALLLASSAGGARGVPRSHVKSGGPAPPRPQTAPGSLQKTSDLLWPFPTTLSTGTNSAPLAVQTPGDAFFAPQEAAKNSKILSDACHRYAALLKARLSSAEAAGRHEKHDKQEFVSAGSSLLGVRVFVKDVASPLQLGVDESYAIAIAAAGGFAELNATTVWGALHGLELFTQMMQVQGKSFVIADTPVAATAQARFQHRGLLLDSARHYLPLDTIKRAVDALAYSHMNVLHWHAVDAESFPVESPSSPRLSMGAWAPSAVYSMADVQSVIKYANARGVRVVMEFDTPGHSDSWEKGYPKVTAKCPDWSANINNVPLNPAVDEAWTVLAGLLKDVTSVIQDDFLHIGGDEVEYVCWKEDAILKKWMAEKGWAGDYNRVMQYYEERLWGMVQAANKSMIAWEEVFNGYDLTNLPASLVIEVWKDEPTLLQVANAGYRGILAYGWYLDHLALDWKAFYGHEPFTSTAWNAQNEKRIIGGEAAAWGEQIDQFNFDARVWPRTAAAAERLWSPKDVTDVAFAQTRLVNQICRLNARGIRAAPIVPNWCPE